MCSPCSLCECTSMPWCMLSLQAPLRMEMKGVCNEFHSARVPDPTAISQLRGENQRDGGQRWREEEAQGKTQRFFFLHLFFFTPPSFRAWLPSCYNVKLAFLSVYREQCGTVTWRGEERRGEWFWREVRWGLGLWWVKEGGEGWDDGGDDGIKEGTKG